MRPVERITASICSGGNSCPCSAPADREIDSFISVPPRSLTPARKAAATPSGPSFTQETCTFVIHGCSASRATACTSSVSPKVGPERARPRSHIGASMCTNGSGTNSVNPPDSRCCSRACRRWRAQFTGPSTWPNIIVTFERKPDSMGGVVHLEPLRGRDLVRTDHAPDLVVEDLRGRTGERTEACIVQARQVVLERKAERRRSLPHLQRRERVDVQPRHCVLDRLDDREVVVTGEGGMDPALQAHLRRAAFPRLLAAADDLLVRHEIRRPAQVGRELSLRERAEAATEVADVGVLDVARHDVGHLVTAHITAQAVGGGEDAVALLAARAEETHDLLLAELVMRVDRQRVARDERDRPSLARRPRVLAREPDRVRRPQHRRHDVRVEPLSGDPLRIDGEPRRELETAALGRRTQPFDFRPGRFGIDVVDRDR